MTTQVQFRHVGKVFQTSEGPLPVLNNINFEIGEGEFIAIVGASGCGKSTLLRLLMGLDSPDTGHLIWSNSKQNSSPRDVGVVFQDHRLFPWMSVYKNIQLGLEHSNLGKEKQDKRIADILALVGLEKFSNTLPSRLSGGMAQRAAIARALVGSPDLLLLDEPFGALDAFTKLQLQHELAKIWDRDRLTTVLVTHDIEEAIFLADRIIVLEPRPGQIKEVFHVEFLRPRSRSTFEFQDLKNQILKLIFREGQRDLVA